MYNRTNRASIIAQIGAMNRPKITEGKSIDFAGAVNAYFQGKEQAERRAKEKEQQEKVNAWVDQLNADTTLSDTDKAYFTANPEAYGQRMASLNNFNQQKELAAINNAAALERIKQTYANKGNGGFGNTKTGLIMTVLSNPENYSPEVVQMAQYEASRLSPEGNFELAYQKKKGSKQAESEFEKAANAYASSQRASNLQDVLSEVQGMDRRMFTPVGEVQAKIGQIGDVFGASNLGGMSETDRTQRAALDRAITDIGQDLIAKAKSKGQAGINTVAEINRILGSLSMTGGKAELIGSLQRLLEQEQILNSMDTVATPMPEASKDNTQTIGGFKIREIK